MSPHRKSIRGEVATALLVGLGALAIGVFAGGWKPLELFRKKPPTAELTKLQVQLEQAQATLAAAEAARQAAALEERKRQEDQVRYAQQMQAGAQEALDRQPSEHRTDQTRLAGTLLKRSELALALAIGQLPPAQQAEILRIVDGALSSIQAERDAAMAALRAKDGELRALTAERDAIRNELPKLEAKAKEAEAAATRKQQEVTAVTNEVKAKADALDAEKRKAGSFAAQIDRLWRVIAIIAAIWAVLTYIVPGFIKHLDAGWLKTLLRDASGYATSPLLYHDARKKLKATRITTQ